MTRLTIAQRNQAIAMLICGTSRRFNNAFVIVVVIHNTDKPKNIRLKLVFT